MELNSNLQIDQVTALLFGASFVLFVGTNLACRYYLDAKVAKLTKYRAMSGMWFPSKKELLPAGIKFYYVMVVSAVSSVVFLVLTLALQNR